MSAIGGRPKGEISDQRQPPNSYRIKINGVAFRVVGGRMYGTSRFFIHLVQALDPCQIKRSQMPNLVHAVNSALFWQHGINGEGLQHSMIDITLFASSV